MTFTREIDFEEALTQCLLKHGWNEVIANPTEDDLVKNWAQIIYDNNRDINLLGKHPLTEGEMRQIMDRLSLCNSPYDVSRFINAQTVSIKREHPDAPNCGNEIYLKIFDPREIRSGQSRYQIARQPQLRTSNAMLGDRRGDILLLINGMPVIHIELKRSNVDVSQATYQLKRYAHEGVFSQGMLKLVQIMVAMTPEETLYFANPGEESNFAPQFYFHWQDFNNNVMRDWQQVATNLLSIPMAHQMIGYYTIADDKDHTLKVLRSYQYYAANAICDTTHNNNWDDHEHRGGYIWHTTGSGKTMTSFKSAQLIASSGDADKVVFLLDRIELSVQSLDEYRGFAGDADNISDTANTDILLSKLESDSNDDRLIVTSLQKMSNINAEKGVDQLRIDRLNQKRLVFVVDECHRSTFGEMLVGIKHTFNRSLMFGFTGTPVFPENARNEITTETIFGNNLHKYTIANGIEDKNVLGFDVYRVDLHDEMDLRELAAFNRINKKLKEADPTAPDVTTLDEIQDQPELLDLYDKTVNHLKMPSAYFEDGRTVTGVEAYLPKNVYQCEEHYRAVIDHIMSEREALSKNYKFHAMLATKSIPEAIAYYRLFREMYPWFKVATVFDNNIDNSDAGIAREDAIVEMLTDYNSRYNQTFQLANYARYKKDVAKRLAHKKTYVGIEHDHSKQIDLLIVVTQMLTGYDSKWVNTLYVDKTMQYVDVIQAFSRTNRLFGPDKPFGIVKYYTKPATMQQNIEDALEVYVDRAIGAFVDGLEVNLNSINALFNHIREIFKAASIANFERLPDSNEARNMFAKDFSKMTHLIEAAKLQLFTWDKKVYEFQHEKTYSRVTMEIDEATYNILLMRYRELFEGGESGSHIKWDGYPIDLFIFETGTGTIDAEYINSKFQRFVKTLYFEGPEGENTRIALEDLCKQFASLSQKDQRTALVILHDIQCGDLRIEAGKSILDYINEYQKAALDKQIITIADAFGIDYYDLARVIENTIDESNINEFGRYEALKATIIRDRASEFLTKVYGMPITGPRIMMRADSVLRKFILDPSSRERIIEASVNDDVTIDTVPETPVVTTDDFVKVLHPAPAPVVEVAPAPVVATEDKVRSALLDVFGSMLSGVSRYLRGMDEVVDNFIDVLNRKSIDTLDGVGSHVMYALSEVFASESCNIVRKSVAFNLLATKYESYLKKLYYLINDKEVQPQYEGEDVTWKHVIHAFRCLWGLKNNLQPEYQKLYGYLMMVKTWRNDESHISPTASEEEFDAAIKIIIAMYGYVTACSITELEEADAVRGSATADLTNNVPFAPVVTYTDAENIVDYHKAAESADNK